MLNLIEKTMDNESRPFWEGVKNNELRIQHCDDCNTHIFYPRTYCPHCFSDNVSWKKASGKGRIYSYTVVHNAFGEFADQVPYVVALVDLEEGVRMLTRIVGDRDQVAIDKPVSVTFEKVNDFTLPYFQLD